MQLSATPANRCTMRTAARISRWSSTSNWTVSYWSRHVTWRRGCHRTSAMPPAAWRGSTKVCAAPLPVSNQHPLIGVFSLIDSEVMKVQRHCFFGDVNGTTASATGCQNDPTRSPPTNDLLCLVCDTEDYCNGVQAPLPLSALILALVVAVTCTPAIAILWCRWLIIQVQMVGDRLEFAMSYRAMRNSFAVKNVQKDINSTHRIWIKCITQIWAKGSLCKGFSGLQVIHWVPITVSLRLINRINRITLTSGCSIAILKCLGKQLTFFSSSLPLFKAKLITDD